MGNGFPDWIPQEIIEAYAKKGITSLFEWQRRTLDEVFKGSSIEEDGIPSLSHNVVYNAPTSAGKSLVAELICLSSLLKGLRVLFVLPYISVAREKFIHLQRLWRTVDLSVASFIGVQSSSPFGEWNAAVCTIEKANSLLNALIVDEKEGLNKLGVIILDELHMVADSSRGPTIDCIAAKLSFGCSQMEGRRPRIVGMTATMGDEGRIGEWMETKVISAKDRPILLDESIYIDGRREGIWDEMKRDSLEDEHSSYEEDYDHTAGLSISSFSRGERVLVFCSSKAEVERTATLIAKTLHSLFKKGSPLRSLVNTCSLMKVKNEIERRALHLDPLLLKTLPRSVAFHHAGLTAEEREVIEGAFSEGTLSILVATSTLSSGVNLPANRVIIRAQVRGPAALTHTTYRQMAGRAGRLGHVERGESILVCHKGDEDTVKKIIKTNGNDIGVYGVKRDAVKIVLESVATGLCSTIDDVTSLLSRLLFPSSKSTHEYMDELQRDKLMRVNEDACLSPTQLGMAALSSSLPPDAALFVFSDLQLASRSLALDTELHMLYLVTPINYTVFSGVNWSSLHSIHSKLAHEEKRVAKLVGVSEGFIVRRMAGVKVTRKEERSYQVHLRFFSSLALFEVVNEHSLTDVATRFNINRGNLQTLQYQSATYAAMVVAFCSRLGWTYLRSLLDGFAVRLSFGVRAELTELVRVEGIDGARARAFHDDGISSLSQLAQCTIRDITQVLTRVVPFDSEADNDGKGEWLFGEERNGLDEAANIIRERATNALYNAMKSLGVSPHTVILTRTQENDKKVIHKVDGKKERDGVFVEDQPRIEMKIMKDEEESVESGYGSGGRENDEMNEEEVMKEMNAQIEEVNESIELFSQSIEDMSLDEREEEMEDLETSLRRMSTPVKMIEDDEEKDDDDSFYRTVCFLTQRNQKGVDEKRRSVLGELKRNEESERTQLANREGLHSSLTTCGSNDENIPDHDSFYDSLCFISQVEPSGGTDCVFEEEEDKKKIESDRSMGKSQKSKQKLSEKKVTVGVKRPRRKSRLSVLSSSSPLSRSIHSPSTSSPLAKQQKRSSHPSIIINDVCSSYSSWSSFLSLSSSFSSISLGLATMVIRGGERVCGVAVTDGNGEKEEDTVYYIPLTDHDIYGTEEDEKLARSSTPLQEISLNDRKSSLCSLIKSSPRLLLFDALRGMQMLRDVLQDMDELDETQSLICLTYLSFLAQMRKGDSPLSIHEIASSHSLSTRWQPFLSSASPRLKCCAMSWIGARIEGSLTSRAISLSSSQSIQLEMKAIGAIDRISSRGFGLNRLECDKRMKEMRKRMEKIEDETQKFTGRKKVNLESPTQVSEILFTHLGLPYPGSANATLRKHLPTNKTVLEQLTGLHPLPSLILEYRRLKHAISQCLVPLLDSIPSSSSSSSSIIPIHTRFSLFSSTGRVISSHPNIQNVGKDPILPDFSLRSLFVPRSGYILVSADFCQLELRVLAHLSGENKLKKLLNDKNIDIFTQMSEEWKKPRGTVKVVCYGIIYGMGAKTLAEKLECSREEAQKMISDFFNTFPKTRTFISCTNEKSGQGFVETCLGRRRLCTGRGNQESRSREERQAVNFTIQGTASEIFKSSLLRVQSAIQHSGGRIVMQVHDEIIVEIPSSSCNEDIKNKLKNAMEEAFPKCTVSLPVKICEGSNWSQLK